jgi:hypothetical protein
MPDDSRRAGDFGIDVNNDAALNFSLLLDVLPPALQQRAKLHFVFQC